MPDGLTLDSLDARLYALEAQVTALARTSASHPSVTADVMPVRAVGSELEAALAKLAASGGFVLTPRC